MNRQDLLDLIPAYALGALDDDAEAKDALQQLLLTDEEAQAQLREYEAITELLTLGVPERQPPASLRASLQDRLAARRDATPETSVPVATAPDSKPAPATKSASVMPFPVWAWAAAAVFIMVIGLGIILTQTETPIQLTAGEQRYNELADQGDATRFTTEQGDLLIAADGTGAVLRIADLTDRTDEQSYQLWLIGEEQIQSAGVFNWTNGNEPYFVTLEQPLSDIGTVAISLEPQGGSPLEDAPSGEVLFAVELAN